MGKVKFIREFYGCKMFFLFRPIRWGRNFLLLKRFLKQGETENVWEISRSLSVFMLTQFHVKFYFVSAT